MSYDLEHQHKERRLIFEMEMQNRLYYLANVNKLIDYSIHSLPTKPCKTDAKTLQNVTSVYGDKTADNHIPSRLEEWLHEKTYSEENFIR